MSTYDLTLNGNTERRLNKRAVILRIVHALVSHGAHPDDVAPLLPWGDRAFFSAEGQLTGGALGQLLPHAKRARYSLEDDQLLYAGGRTFALTNQWGDPSWSACISELAAKWPALGIQVELSECLPRSGAIRGASQTPVDGAQPPHPGSRHRQFPEVPSTMLGAAGEYYVVFQLHRRGFLAGLAPRGYPDVDIITLARSGQVAALIQVKTRRRGNNGGWRMHAAHEELSVPGLIFCFVDLEPSDPAVFIVPATIATEAVRSSHAAWLSMGAHNDHDMRTLTSDWGFPVPGFPPRWLEEYRDAWDYVGAPQTAHDDNA